MIKSMTGFGKATVDCGTKKVIVEVKSLNSKQLDINLRTPSIYKEKDIEIRNMIKNVLERGKVDVYIYFDNAEDEKDVAVNQSVVRQYYNQMLEVAGSLGVEINKSARHQGQIAAADLGVAHLHHRVLRVELPVGILVGLLDPFHILHDVQGGNQVDVQLAGITHQS